MKRDFQFKLLAILFALSLCSSLGNSQETPSRNGDAQTESHPLAMFSSDFDIKVDEDGFFVRKKGTEKWTPASKYQALITVGALDPERKVYLVTKAIKAPKAKRTEDPEYPVDAQ